MPDIDRRGHNRGSPAELIGTNGHKSCAPVSLIDMANSSTNRTVVVN